MPHLESTILPSVLPNLKLTVLLYRKSTVDCLFAFLPQSFCLTTGDCSNPPFSVTSNQPFCFTFFTSNPPFRVTSNQSFCFTFFTSSPRFASPQINRFAFRSLLQIHRFASPQINHFDLLSLPQISYFALPQVTVQNPPCYYTSKRPFYRTTSNRFAFLPQISRFALITTSNRSIPSSFPTLTVRFSHSTYITLFHNFPADPDVLNKAMRNAHRRIRLFLIDQDRRSFENKTGPTGKYSVDALM